MKKILIFAVLAYVSAAMVTSCGSDDDNYLDKMTIPPSAAPITPSDSTGGGSTGGDSIKGDSIPAPVDPLYNTWYAAVTGKGTDITLEITENPYFDFVNYINTGSKGSAADPSIYGHTALNIKYYYTKTTVVDQNKIAGNIYIIGLVPTVTVEQGYITADDKVLSFWAQKQYKSTDGHSFTAVPQADMTYALDMYRYEVYENVLYLIDMAGGVTVYTTPVPQTTPGI